MTSYIQQWHFDWVSSFATLFVAPIAIYLVVAARRFLKDVGRYIIDGLVYALNKTIIHRAAASLTLKRYCRLQLAGPSKYLHIPASIEISLEIDSIFVPLTLENRGINVAFSNSSVLDAGNRIRIIGDPGSGKSSVAKWIFRNECGRGLLTPGKSRFPVLIELRTLDVPKNIARVKLGDWFLAYIQRLCSKYDVYNLVQCFEAYTAKSGLLIILDGLDEVSSAVYDRTQAAINLLSAKLQELGENNAIILTMRTQFHRQIKIDFDTSFPIVLSVKRFSPSDIYQFLTRWPFSANKLENVIRIYNDLTDRPSLRKMCTNPLVLSMYVAQDQASGYQIAPDSRTDFYSKVAEELLIRRRAKQIGPTNVQAVVREQRQRILGQIAPKHLTDQRQSLNLIPWTDGIEAVNAVTGITNTDDAETLFRELAKETGLITEEQERETFRFIHLTFCEYFGAYESIHGQSDGWNSLVHAHRGFLPDPTSRSRLVETLPFAAALAPRHMRPQCLEDVASCNDSHLLTLTFLETKLYSHDLWEKFVDSSISGLLAVSEVDWDSEWLRKLHLFLVVASDAERAASVTKAIRRADGVTIFFRRMANKSPSPIAALIRNYAEQDAAAAFRVATLCNVDLLQDVPELVIENCDQPPFLAIALETASREHTNMETWACLFAEAGLRSAAVAVSLAGREERDWRDVASRIGHANWWSFSNVVNSSFYADCLLIARTSNIEMKVTPLLLAFRAIPGPNQEGMWSITANFFQRRALVLFLLCYSAGPMILAVEMWGRRHGLFFFGMPFVALGIAAGLLGLALSSFAFGVAAVRRARLYLEIINLKAIIRRSSLEYNPLVTLLRLLRRRSAAKVPVSDVASLLRVGLFCSNSLLAPTRTFFELRDTLPSRATVERP